MAYSVRYLTVFLLVCVSIVPIMIFGLITTYEDEQILRERQLAFLEETVTQQVRTTDLFFTERFFDISVLSQIPAISNNLELIFSENFENSPQYKTISNTLSLYQENYNYESIWLLDLNHNTILVVGHDKEFSKHSKTISHEEHEQMLKGPFLSNVYRNDHDDVFDVELYISTPLYVDSKVVGFMILDFPVDSFLQNFDSLLDSTHSGETLIFQKIDDDIYSLSPLRFGDVTPFSEPLLIHELSSIPALESTSGMTGTAESVDYRGESIFASWKYSDVTKWGFVAKIDSSEALTPIEDEKILTVAMIGILITASLVISTVMYNIVISPLRKLSIAAQKIKRQEFDLELSPTGPSEISDITNIFNEMTQSLKKSQELSEEEIRELEKIDQQKGEFAVMASHELKTPLVPIKGYLEMLLEPDLVGSLSEKQCEILHKVYENTELIERLVLKILTAQRLGLGQMKWKFSEFDIFDLMEDVYKDNKPLMDDKEIKFVLEPVSNCMINSDYDQIKQVFSNLIQNAVDFVSHKGEITITATTKEEFIEFSVSDNGPGISDEHQRHLFKKFYQVDTSVRRKHGGTGLGLSICKGICDGLKGKIWVKSQLGSGSTFYFTIPKEKKI